MSADERSLLDAAAGLFPQWVLGADEQAVIDGYNAQRREALGRHVAKLLSARDARSQLDYALLAPMVSNTAGQDTATAAVERARRDQAISKAAAADPDDVMAAWMEALDCTDASLCDKADARRRLQQLDPDNALVWMLDLDDVAGLSPQQVDQILGRMASSARFSDMFDPATARMHSALQRAQLSDPGDAVLAILDRDPFMQGRPSNTARQYGEVMGMSTAIAFPAIGPLSNACRGTLSASRHTACVGAMTRIADAGSLLFDGLSIPRMVALTAGRPEQAEWRERYRQHAWRTAKVAMPMDARWLDLRMRMSEVDAHDALQVLRGRPVVPPPGWLPKSEAARSLVVNGRPPGG